MAASSRYTRRQLAGGPPSTPVQGERRRELALAGKLEQLYRKEQYLSAILQLVSDVNQVLLHATSMEQLLRRSCERITRHEDYCVAWIGLREDDDSLRVAYQSDRCEVPYLGDDFHVSLVPGDPGSAGPAGRCVLENRTVVIDDTQKDPGFAPWRDRARCSGIHSVAGLPLRATAGAAPFGCLLIYMDSPDGFAGRELRSLQDVADAIGRAVHLRRETDQRYRAEQAARDSEQRFKQLIDALPNVAVQGYDSEHRVIYWNRSSEQLYGYSPDEAVGRRLEQLIIPEPMRETVSRVIDRWMAGGEPIPPGELELQHKDGSQVAVYSSHVLLRGNGSGPEMFCVDVDLREQKRVREQLQRLATVDLLTGLPNRMLLDQELRHRIKEASRYGYGLAILFIDIDNFKLINDSLGHERGDELLRAVSERIGSRLREYEMLARFGGDEFVLVLPRVEQTDEVERVASKVIDGFSLPVRFDDGRETYVTASIGIAIYPEDGRDKTELLKNADMAMYRAKEYGRNRFQFFTHSMNEELQYRQELEALLRQALQRRELVLHYQPQVALRTGAVVSVEALIRWQSPRHGMISPADFLPVAERSELINRIGEWVIEEACRQCRRWRDQGLDLRVDINLSGRQFFYYDVFSVIEAMLDRFGLDHRDLGIELTEQVLIEASGETLAGLERLHRKGMVISLDDFGTGYSSLSYLKRFPVDVIKIDKEFIEGAPVDNNDRSIMEAVVAVGHAMGLEVLAEGVESMEQLRLVREMGCDLGQGYLFQRPQPAASLQYQGNRLVLPDFEQRAAEVCNGAGIDTDG
ncbi:MAG TPA: EAL domain-containing protein [Sedimenticola thiotaurini]|uniref:cyclic-guanylate-specific phosphodiesterase n=1 Tax=Sedimenticola thiotaurini TaxID=1543721 RepID=A0A831RH91_9GAMM|nr:EAL domain-containing protein [Sedimenticola thiotaurini]